MADFTYEIKEELGVLSENAKGWRKELNLMVYTWQLPMNICSKELFQEIIESGINGQYDEEKCTKRLKTQYNKMVETL